MEELISILIQKGEELLNKPFVPFPFTKDEKIDEKLNDLVNCPHHFVLACIMDRQILAERAWKIPFLFGEKFGDHTFDRFLKISQKNTLSFFQENNIHRFNETMANCFYKAIQRIQDDYQGDASRIWKGNLHSATIVRRFLQFDGVGIKIATMATNILARDFKITMQDKICIDISPDVQVKRVFTRLGLISKNASNDELIYCTRELNPNYPGIFDLSAWEIGRNWCRPTNPSCNDCFLKSNCPKIL